MDPTGDGRGRGSEGGSPEGSASVQPVENAAVRTVNPTSSGNPLNGVAMSNFCNSDFSDQTFTPTNFEKLSAIGCMDSLTFSTRENGFIDKKMANPDLQ